MEVLIFKQSSWFESRKVCHIGADFTRVKVELAVKGETGAFGGRWRASPYLNNTPTPCWWKIPQLVRYFALVGVMKRRTVMSSSPSTWPPTRYLIRIILLWTRVLQTCSPARISQMSHNGEGNCAVDSWFARDFANECVVDKRWNDLLYLFYTSGFAQVCRSEENDIAHPTALSHAQFACSYSISKCQCICIINFSLFFFGQWHEQSQRSASLSA